MGRPSNKEERRQQIVDGLKAAMAEKGYEKASIQSIAKAAGLSPGLIHYHFKTKQEILVELTNQLSQTAKDRFTNKVESLSTPIERLNAYIEAALELGEYSDPEAVTAWVLISAEAVRQEEVRTLYQQVVRENLDQLISILTDVKKDKGLDMGRKEITELASLILATIEGCYQLATTSSELLPKDYASKTLKSLTLSLLNA